MALLARWTRMTLLARFTVTGLSVTLVIGVVLAWTLARGQESAALAREAEAAAESARVVLDPAIGSSSLDAPLPPERYAALDRIVRERLVGQHTVRVKVWGLDGTVRYSTDPDEVGQRF